MKVVQPLWLDGWLIDMPDAVAHRVRSNRKTGEPSEVCGHAPRSWWQLDQEAIEANRICDACLAREIP